MEFKSYSQAGQDRFAFELCGASGMFVDIGANHPVQISNTFGLEQIGWDGLLVENDPACLPLLRELRRAALLAEDATAIDWHGLLTSRPVDYLSLDVDAASPHALWRFLKHGPRARCMTVEHDSYRFGDDRRTLMRELLERDGYDVLCDQISHEGCIYEMWAVDPKRVDMAKVERFRRSGPTDWKEFFGQD